MARCRPARRAAARQGVPAAGVAAAHDLGTRWVVSAGHHLAAEAAARILARGGNAIDAGVAGGLVLNVVLPDMCNFGGVAPILVRAAGDDAVWSVSGLGTWGREATLEAFKERYGDELPEGPGNSVVPSAPAAWLAALGRWGRSRSPTWSRPRSSSPPRASRSTCARLRDRRVRARVGYDPGAFPAGRAGAAGRGCAAPAGARDLARVSCCRCGPAVRLLAAAHSAFYEGEVAERIVEFNRATGGWLTPEDLAGFEAEVAPAVARAYGGWRVHTPDTWCQGPALLQALAILEGFDLAGSATTAPITSTSSPRRSSWRSPTGSATTATRGSSMFRSTGCSRTSMQPSCASRSVRATALPNLPTMPRAAASPARHDLSLRARRDGNAFSATPSDTLDGGPIVPGLGIIVSPRGLQSRLDPAHPSVLAPGKRPRLTPSPAIALQYGRGRGRPGVGLRVPGRRRDPAGDAAGVPQPTSTSG